MRAKWFGWYRDVLGQRIHSAYPRSRLEAGGIRGALAFRLELAPDGSVRSLRVLRAEDKQMREALNEALDEIKRFPPYEATGLTFFPPFAFNIHHGPRTTRAPRRGGARTNLCTVEAGM